MGGFLGNDDDSDEQDKLEAEEGQEKVKRVAADKKLQLQRLISLRRRRGGGFGGTGGITPVDPSKSPTVG